EEHALKSLKKKEQSFAVVDPLVYLAKTTPTHPTTSSVTVPHHNHLRRAPGNTGTKGIQTTGSGVNNSGNKVICYNCRGKGHVARQCKEPKRACDSQWYHDKALLMQAKEKGAVAQTVLAQVTSMRYKSVIIHFFNDVSYPLAHEMQQEEHLNSEVDSVLDYNMITYDEYQNDSGVKAVLTVVSADEANKQSMIAILQRMHTEIAGYVRVNDEHKLVNATLTAKLERCKIEMQALEHNKLKHDLYMAIVERNKRNTELKEENVMLKSTLKSKVVSIENLQQESKQTGLGYSNPRYGKEARIIQPALYDGLVLLNMNHPPTRVHDSEESLVHAEVYKIKMAKRPGHALPINYDKLNALQSSNPAKPVAPFVHTRPLKSDVHKKLKEQLQGRDDSIRNLQAQNDIMSLLNVGSTDDKKIAAQKAKIATLNAKTVGNKTSGTTKPANPKVIALGRYTISPKYIVPQRKTHRETLIPLPKKKQVTFQETPKPSPRFTKKSVAPLLKKPNVNVPLSTGIKSATGASNPASKSNAWIYRKLPAKSAKGEKEDEKKRLDQLKRDQTMLLIKIFSERKKVFRERKKTEKIHAKRWTLGGNGGELFCEGGDDFEVDVLLFRTCLIDILGFLGKFGWWFEQDIGGESEDDKEKKLVMVGKSPSKTRALSVSKDLRCPNVTKNLERKLNKETLHKKDSNSDLSVIKVQFDHFIHSKVLERSKNNSHALEITHDFKAYTNMEAQTFKETIIQNIRIVSGKGNDQSIENQSNTYRDESNRSRNECNDKGTSGDDTDIKPSYETELMVEVPYNVEYNVFAIESQHSKQPENMNDTSLMENVDRNTTPDLSDICNNEFKDDPYADDHENERAVLADLIAKLKCDIDENKKIQKQLRNANTSLLKN
nr:hypothetical protein [Tanacetum cinerariifolium]